MLLVDAAHQRGCWRENLVDEDEDGLLRRKLDTLTDDVDELAYRQVRRDQVLLLVDGCDVALLYFFADDLLARCLLARWHEEDYQATARRAVNLLTASDALNNESGGKGCKNITYRNAVTVLLANPLGLGLALLEGMLVLELASHLDGDCGWLEWVEAASDRM